ncbi:MAG: site-specific integrase [Anaerolineaceae bacterium]|jgi:site-specific recombinase XerD|nr:site-specific integrase [Anaerolineaceae bacterium]
MSPSIQEAIQVFKSNVQFENENTRRLYFRGLDAFFEYLQDNQLDNMKTTQLKKNVVVEFGGWMKDTRAYAIPTRRLYISVLRAALRFWRANYSGWIQFTREEEQEASRTSLIGNPEEQTSRHERLPEDFGNHMLTTVMKLTLPKKQLDKLEVLRKRTLVVLLRATALRIGDLCQLTRQHVDDARVQNGRLEIRMEKTGRIAHCRLGPDTLEIVEEYLTARDDHSPWVFIQHGKSNRRRHNSSAFFKNAKRGYGARLSSTSAWRIVQEVAALAGLDREKYFTSPHAFRHWHAKTLIENGVSLENIQAVLGHSTPATTRIIYAPEPDKRQIDQIEQTLQKINKYREVDDV